jgi:hypothetical protein
MKKNKNLIMNLKYELKCLDGSQAPSEVTKYVRYHHLNTKLQLNSKINKH